MLFRPHADHRPVRRHLVGAVVLGSAALLAVSGCTSNTPEPTTSAPPQSTGTGGSGGSGSGNDAPGEKVTIGFSAPAADHGWIASITHQSVMLSRLWLRSSGITKGAVDGGRKLFSRRKASSPMR